MAKRLSVVGRQQSMAIINCDDAADSDNDGMALMRRRSNIMSHRRSSHASITDNDMFVLSASPSHNQSPVSVSENVRRPTNNVGSSDAVVVESASVSISSPVCTQQHHSVRKSLVLPPVSILSHNNTEHLISGDVAASGIFPDGAQVLTLTMICTVLSAPLSLK